MSQLIKELSKTIMVDDPCIYEIDKRILNSIIYRKYHLISFYKYSYVSKNIDKIYWRKVNYHFLENKCRGTDIEWFEFTGKHMCIVN
jgi:hypothetical protein